MAGDTIDPAKLRSTGHIRPFVYGQILTVDDYNRLLESWRHLDMRITELEMAGGIDRPPLAPPYDPNENPLPIPGGDFDLDPDG
jgi:hypothetical protein